MTPERAARRAMTLIELLVVIAIIGVLAALIVPAVERVRATAIRGECANNMRQIGLGVMQHHDIKGAVPAGHHWMFDIFPYIGQEALYDKGWSSLWENGDAATIVPTLICGADPRDSLGAPGPAPASATLELRDAPTRWAHTSYLGVLGKDSAFEGNNSAWGDGIFGAFGRRLDHVTDGLSNTIMVGERPPPNAGAGQLFLGAWAGAFGDNSLWAANAFSFVTSLSGDAACPSPAYFSPGDLVDPCHINHFWSLHAGGGNWLLCDGSVRFVSFGAGTGLIPDMATIAGGEVVPALE